MAIRVPLAALLLLAEGSGSVGCGRYNSHW
jgi:hypothetical protein